MIIWFRVKAIDVNYFDLLLHTAGKDRIKGAWVSVFRIIPEFMALRLTFLKILN